MLKHTPVPWGINELRTAKGAPIIMSATSWLKRPREVCKVLYDGGSEDPEVRANAALIVRAVNSHEALTTATEQVLRWIDTGCDPSSQSIANLRTALKLAKGEL